MNKWFVVYSIETIVSAIMLVHDIFAENEGRWLQIPGPESLPVYLRVIGAIVLLMGMVLNLRLFYIPTSSETLRYKRLAFALPLTLVTAYCISVARTMPLLPIPITAQVIAIGGTAGLILWHVRLSRKQVVP